MDFDTLDDVPDMAMNAMFLQELLFSHLRHRVGVVFTGLASQQFASESDWGRSIQLSIDETLQFRISPRGLLGGETPIDLTNRVILLTARRRGPVGKDYVSLAILWDGDRAHNLEYSAFDIMRMNCQVVACRNLHIFLPSIFNHHDADYGGAPEGQKPSPLWGVVDEFNFHAIRPCSFSVTKPVKVQGSTDALLSFHAAPGTSQFVMAGHFANVDVEDHIHRAAEPVTMTQWQRLCSSHADALQKKVGFDRGLSSMHAAMTVADLLTIEGALGILSHNFCSGALPDMIHSPGGFPLLIAFAVRLSCYPERFGCAPCTPADKWANSELCSIFESNWEPITAKKAGEHYLYAIDLMIKGSYKDAMQNADKNSATQSVRDNITFWQRAGQRCISELFGPNLDDFIPVVSPFGKCDRLQDPLAEARSRVLQKKMNVSDVTGGLDSGVSVEIATHQQKRNTLLMVLNSVEHWGRTGQYCDMQIHSKNRVNMSVRREDGSNKTQTKQEIREALNAGMEDSIREMVESGEASNEEDARSAASVLRDGVEAALAFHEDDEVVTINDLKLKLPAEVLNDARDAELPPEYEEIDPSLDPNHVCFAAFNHGMSALAAAMCQGPMVHHQFSMGCFLASPYAVNKCADCDAEVHLLTSTFLSTRFGSCPTCQRPRCLVCMTKVHSSTPRYKHDPAKCCMRCKAAKAGQGRSPDKAANKQCQNATCGKKKKKAKAAQNQIPSVHHHLVAEAIATQVMEEFKK